MEDLFQHATCAAKHPQGSLKMGDSFTTLCGKESAIVENGWALPKCPDCSNLFGAFAKDKDTECPVCGLTRRDHPL